MASRRHQRRIVCERKRAFPTEGSALSCIDYHNRRADLQAYQCPRGGHYHIGHFESGFAGAIANSMGKRR